MGREVRYLEARNVTLQFIHLERGDLVSKEDDKETSPDLESSLCLRQRKPQNQVVSSAPAESDQCTSQEKVGFGKKGPKQTDR